MGYDFVSSNRNAISTIATLWHDEFEQLARLSQSRGLLALQQATTDYFSDTEFAPAALPALQSDLHTALASSELDHGLRTKVAAIISLVRRLQDLGIGLKGLSD